MKKILSILMLCAAVCGLNAADPAADTKIYDEVTAFLAKQPHRVPGSPEYYEAIDFMEKTLAKTGLEVHRQTYRTLVPKIVKNEFSVDGKPAVIWPLAPNNASLLTTGPKPIEAPIVYIPQSELDKNYGSIGNKIVLLDWGEIDYTKTFFQEGARAIIFIGNDKTTQWDAAKLQSQFNIAFPYFYMTREEAKKHHLLDATPGKEKSARLILNSQWDTVEGVNLWAVSKAKAPKVFNLSQEEAVVLGARLDTFGAVPGLVAGDRQNANLALFAQTAAGLTQKELSRTIFFVLYGSAFNTYDSLRNFYFPILLRNSNSKPTLGDFADGYRKEAADNDKLLDILNTNPVVKKGEPGRNKSKMIFALLGMLLLFGGLIPVAYSIKMKKLKPGLVGAGPALAGIVFIVMVLAGVFNSSEEDKLNHLKDVKDEMASLNLKLEKQKSLTAKEKTDIKNQLQTLKTEKIKLESGDEDEMHYRARMMIRDQVIKDYNQKNYRLADINVQLRRNADKLKNEANLSESARKELEAETQKLKEEKDVLDRDKVSVANMRGQINEREVEDKYQHLLESFCGEVKKQLDARKNELNADIKTADDWQAVAAAAKPYAFVGAYYFDFASDEQPFFLATRSFEAPHSFREMNVSVYSKYFECLRKVLPDMQLQKSKTPYFMESFKSSTFTPDTLSSLSLVYLPHTASLPLKLSSFTLRNIPGDYDFDEIPGRHQYRLSGLIPVTDEFFSRVADEPGFSMYPSIQDTKLFDDLLNYWYDGDYHGRSFSFLSQDGKEIDGPAAGAIAMDRQNEYDRIYPVCGFSLAAMGMVNHAGFTTMPLLTSGGRWGGGDLKIAGEAMAFDEYGNTMYMSTRAEYFKLFRCYGGAHVYTYAPLTSNFAGSLELVNGFTDGKFKNSRTYARVATGDGYAFADRDVKSKIYFFNETFILGSSPEDPIGKGIPIDAQSLLNLNVSRIAVDNTILLNLQRLEKLHRRNIFNGVIEQYHDSAEQHRDEAKKALSEGKVNLARAHEIFGQTLAVRAYRPLRDMINDLVQSVLILLILTIPFAFALERLIVGSTSIYKQMLWILIFFVGTFLMLYFTHPAFALSQAPMIIFIAFFIIVMSVIVIYIVMNRFKSELRAMQGMDTSAHRVSSENSMLLAAILIGVSSMKNRPVKTFLTILTVVLLTFTIISFASFSSTEYVRPVYMGDGSGEVRIESFLPQHVDLLMPTCDAVRDLYRENYDVYFRSASYNSPFYMLPTYPVQTNSIFNPACEKPDERSVQLEAVVGFELSEREHSAKLASLMPKPASIPAGTEDLPGVYLSDKTATQIELKPGDVFYLRNMKVRLDGVFKAADLDAFTYLDNGKAVPPNFEATASAEEKDKFAVFNSAYVDASNFIWSSPDLSLLTDYDTARRINGFVNAVVLYPKEGRNPDIIKDATSIAEVTFGIVYSNTANGVHRHFMAPVFAASGFSNLFVPLLLGALIILSSLLGSIADREREIFTFSALGLSPKDVSILFFAESGVYAVIGGLGGYLLSQVTSAALNALSKRGILQAPEMNYSSMTTVYTILIVMAIVLLSTIYPAIKAGLAASPDVARKWKMPPPEGDNLGFQFPFTVFRLDFGGILVFIGEHFGNHTDSSLGSFAASNIRITHGKTQWTDGYLLSVDLTLAPFDLGVAEELRMFSAPSDIEGVDVVTVSIQRKDGSKGAWLRGNRRFVDEIRNQFLLWRSLPVETVMHYRELAAQKLNGADTTQEPEGAKA